jgi:hypothetical protein
MEWGGALALLLSLATGAYTFYTNEIRKPAEEAMQKFQTSISGINSINQETPGKLAAISDPAARYATVQIANAQKSILVNEAERAFSDIKNKDKISPYELFILANENAMMSRYKKMDDYLDLAESNANQSDDEIAKSSVLVWKGKALITEHGSTAMGNARTMFDRAQNELSQLTVLPDIHLRRAALYSDMAIIEANVGDCNIASDDKNKFMSQISPIVTMTAATDMLTITQNTLAMQHRCPL